MPAFAKYYRSIFERFGYPLTKSFAISSKAIAAHEKRLGIRVPSALREYYAVAGNEHRFNECHNLLLAPEDWTIDQRRLVFMQENQGALWWGVSIRNPTAENPPISLGMDDEPMTWCREHSKCSKFLAFMLHYHAINGGFRFSGTAAPCNGLKGRLKIGWQYYGDVKGMTAYSRAGQVVCLQEPAALTEQFLMPAQVLAAGKTKRDLQAIASDLGLTFE